MTQPVKPILPPPLPVLDYVPRKKPRRKSRWLIEALATLLAMIAMFSFLLTVEMGIIWLVFRESKRPEVESQQKMIFLGAAVSALLSTWFAARLWKRWNIENTPEAKKIAGTDGDVSTKQ